MSNILLTINYKLHIYVSFYHGVLNTEYKSKQFHVNTPCILFYSLTDLRVTQKQP